MSRSATEFGECIGNVIHSHRNAVMGSTARALRAGILPGSKRTAPAGPQKNFYRRQPAVLLYRSINRTTCSVSVAPCRRPRISFRQPGTQPINPGSFVCEWSFFKPADLAAFSIVSILCISSPLESQSFQERKARVSASLSSPEHSRRCFS